MVRTLLCSLAGAGAGFLGGFLVVFAVVSLTADHPTGDIVPVSLFVGVFLAGPEPSPEPSLAAWPICWRTSGERTKP